jgi:hypothetical protein
MIETYPRFRQVCLDMCYDNGGINRFRTEAQFLSAVDDVIKEFDPELISESEVFLNSLSDNERAVVADGEEEEVASILVKMEPDHGVRLNQLLIFIFNEAVCPDVD